MIGGGTASNLEYPNDTPFFAGVQYFLKIKSGSWNYFFADTGAIIDDDTPFYRKNEFEPSWRVQQIRLINEVNTISTQ